MNSPEKDYTHRGWIAVAALIAVLAVVSFIPPHIIGGVAFRRANIFSDILSFDDALGKTGEPCLFNEEEFRVNMSEVTERIEADSLPPQVQTTYRWDIPRAARAYALPRQIDSARHYPAVVPVETFDTVGVASFGAFCDTLLAARRPVRIAVLGDSFIEGDILTADLREPLQTIYGGGGTGFAPMASPLTAFRRTVRTQSKGWTTYNIMQYKTTPVALRANYYVSGWICQPSAGATTRWENTAYRQQLDSCTAARVLFLSPHDSRVEVTINDTLRREFAVEGNAAVRQIAVSAPHIHSLGFRVISGTEGFTGYGALLEGDGVVVDNYSIRSNNGQAMFRTNPSVNAQINDMLGYDLVVLQYGLNIMQNGVRNYTNYGRQIEKMVTYVRQCFPGAAVLVLGVSDRSARTDEGFAPMDAVPYMLATQRQAARSTHAAFWPTSDAMRMQGGMATFVRNGWAGKDYTHINYAGGRRVAWALCDAINSAAAMAYQRQQINAKRLRNAQVVLDTTRLNRIGRQLRINSGGDNTLNPSL